MPRALQDMQIVFLRIDYIGSYKNLPSVTFTAAGTERRQRSMFTRDLLKQSFPALFEREMAKAAFPEAHIGHESPVHTIVVSPDGLWVASAADDDSVLLWCAEDGSVVDVWNVPPIRGLMFNSESRDLTICSRDRLFVRDMKPPFKIVAETPFEPEADTCAWSPDGTLGVLSGYPYSEVFRIRAIRTGTLEAVSDYQLTLPHRRSAI
ncbi:hypothetical protein K466DRAFT_595077 [Polyporus arcularius HHB13444]|uniref:Uncharacterized protein n=1 Tax=Polyporus arcularius HHB13444 TaxID=1314778 RepID=A0A5C3PSX4_9APHY|nr:hypothetical protein K466DRAFT_595077 [Polyporus arcularius HHB13444]